MLFRMGVPVHALYVLYPCSLGSFGPSPILAESCRRPSTNPGRGPAPARPHPLHADPPARRRPPLQVLRAPGTRRARRPVAVLRFGRMVLGPPLATRVLPPARPVTSPGRKAWRNRQRSGTRAAAGVGLSSCPSRAAAVSGFQGVRVSGRPGREVPVEVVAVLCGRVASPPTPPTPPVSRPHVRRGVDGCGPATYSSAESPLRVSRAIKSPRSANRSKGRQQRCRHVRT
jgi:hypothetical protein